MALDADHIHWFDPMTRLRRALLLLFAIGWLEGLALNLWIARHYDCAAPDSISRSAWVQLAGFSIAWVAVAFYIVFGWLAVVSNRYRAARAACRVMAWGLIWIAAWLAVVQGLILHRWCPRCLAAHAAGVVAGLS